jgi:hypothetical protein
VSCAVIDVNAATSGMPQNFPDYIHPNVEGSAAIARVVFSVITSAPNMTPSPIAGPTMLPAGTKGDVNGNGSVDIVDALLIAQYHVGQIPANFVVTNADVNCSGGIDIIDALFVARIYVGLISSFPC